MHDPVYAGILWGSKAYMRIFGYNHLNLYNGRKAFEAMGTRIEMLQKYDTAF